MRMIDADALRDNLQALAYDDWNQGVTTSWADAYREVADMVEEMPTIEPKKGEWNPKEKKDVPLGLILDCSVCGGEVLVNDALAYDFCPYCGADMRGEADG